MTLALFLLIYLFVCSCYLTPHQSVLIISVNTQVSIQGITYILDEEVHGCRNLFDWCGMIHTNSLVRIQQIIYKYP